MNIPAHHSRSSLPVTLVAQPGGGRDFFTVAEVAGKLGMTANALRVALIRHPSDLPRFIRLAGKVLCARRSYQRWEERWVRLSDGEAEPVRKPGRPRRQVTIETQSMEAGKP